MKCGKNNKDSSRFCARCGASLELSAPAEEKPAVNTEAAAFENEKTEIFRDMEMFENEETMILDDSGTYSGFENEETVILDDESALSEETYDERTVPGQDMEVFENEETVILDDVKSPYAGGNEKTDIPSFDYRGHVPVYKESADSDPVSDGEIPYIRELRGLKGLLDDGIITQEEFELKKKFILGIN